MSMSITPPDDIVSALVTEQKAIYVKIAAGKSTYNVSNLQKAKGETITSMCPTGNGVADLVLSLHFLLLGGIGSSIAREYLEVPSDAQSATRCEYMGVTGMLTGLHREVLRKQQWKDGSQEDALHFQWKVAFSAYVIHTLEIRSLACGPFEEEKGSDLSKRIDEIRKVRQPFESILEARSQALSSSENAELETTCAGLYKLLPNELTKGFEEAETVLDKARVLHQVWLDKLGVPASPSTA